MALIACAGTDREIKIKRISPSLLDHSTVSLLKKSRIWKKEGKAKEIFSLNGRQTQIESEQERPKPGE